jgi:tetratricopeptide (TPR) repeat protein
MMANMELHQGRVSGFDWADQAVAVAEDLGLDEDLAHALATMGALAIHLGNVDPVEPCDRALALYTRLGNRSGQAMMLNNLGLAAYYARDWITAADYYEAAVAAHTAAGFDLYAASSANNIGEILADQGRWAEAEVVLGDALAVYEAGRGYEELFVFLNLAVVFAQTGRAAASHELLDRAESGFRAIDSTVQLVDTHTRRAATLLIERRAEAALDALDAAASGAVAQFDSRIARLRGIALAQLGSADAALDALRSASETAAAAGDAYEQALADVVRADLVGSDELRALAQQVFDQLGVVAAPAIPLR